VSKYSSHLLAFLIASTFIIVAGSSSPATAQTYNRLQVLLPGEIADPGTIDGKSGTPDTQTVGVPFNVRVRAVDASWTTQSSITSQIELTSSDETATLPSALQMSAGEIQFTVTINAAGQFAFTASDLTDPTIPEGTSAQLPVVLLQGFEFARINQKNQYAGQPMTIEVHAVDPSGQPVSGYDGPVRLRQLTSFGEGRIEPSTVNLVDGSWSGQVTMYRADETAINRGNVNIYAVLDNDPSRNGTSDPFSVHPGNFSRVQLVVPGQTAEPGSVDGLSGSPATQGANQPFTVEVWATDDYWNPVPSADTVRLISSDGAASTPVTGALTNGFRQFTVSLGTFGAQTLTVSNQTNGSIAGMTSESIQVIPGAISDFTIEPFATPVQAGEPVTVTIRATDGSGNTVPGYAGEANVAANTGPGSISPDRITFVDGEWTGEMTFRGAGGAVSFAVSDFSAPPHLGTSDNFVVLPGAYVKLLVRLPGQSPQGGTATGLSGPAGDQNAGSEFNVTVRAVDEFWNRVPGINNQVELSSSDAFASFPATINLMNGEATVPSTLYRAGNQTVSAVDRDDTNIEAHQSTSVLILPGNYSRVLILSPGEIIAHGTEEGRSGAATDQSINYSFTVTVFATDQWWNPVGGVTDVVRLTSNDPLAELPPDTALVDGMAEMSVRLSTGGYQQITVQNLTQPAMLTSTTEVRAISSGFHLEAEVSATQVMAGEYFDLTVKVTNDAGSVIQEINSTVTITVRNASTNESGAGYLVQAPNQPPEPGAPQQMEIQLLQGEETVQVYYTAVEGITIRASDNQGSFDSAVTEAITVSPGNPDHIAMWSDPAWLGGNKTGTVHAQVLDAFENGVPLQAVSFTLAQGNGVLTPIDIETDAQGIARAEYISPRTPGMSTISSSASGLAAQLEIETALVDPGAGGGHVTNYPNPFHPGEMATTIAYKLDDNASVQMRIFTLSGRLVLEERFESGQTGGTVGLNEITWDGSNGDGDTVATGGYILEIHAQGNGETLHLMRRKIGVVR
jgi:hypothetical protein